MKTIYTTVFCLFFISAASAQAPGQPAFPETAIGASNVTYQYHSLKWQNPGNVVYNEVYLGFDSAKVTNLDPSALFISGYPSTVFDSVLINTQLYYPTRYFWCVVEYNGDGSAQGETWYFNTNSLFLDYVKADDFSFGLGKWSISNSTGCGWQLEEDNNYTLPDPSTREVLTADATLCGGLLNSTAAFEVAEDMQYMFGAKLDFDSDWYTINPVDFAEVEMSTDEGATWSLIWLQFGTSDRNKHISLLLFDQNGIIDTTYRVQVRFRTLQNGPGSWWAIDNVAITGEDAILTHNHPYIYYAGVDFVSELKTVLTWQQPLPAPGDIIQRKQGTPLDAGDYETIAVIQGSSTNTFIDSTVTDSSIYTYRVGLFEAGWLVYSNEATAYVFPPIPVELIKFEGQSYNSGARLNWITATETNNRGFEIDRRETLEKSSQWEIVSFIKGNGTTAETKTYSYIDKNLPAGNYQYRLKQIDFDGSFNYSGIIEVSIDSPGDFSLAQNYPNPFNPVTNLSYVIGHSSFVTLKVYDVLGNEAAVLVNGERPAGRYTIKFDGSNLSSGIYFYRIKAVSLNGSSGDFTAVKKLILLK